MIYQVRANLFFETEGLARGLFAHLEGVFPQSVPINPYSEEAEYPIIELIENHHDESPNASCSLLASRTHTAI